MQVESLVPLNQKWPTGTYWDAPSGGREPWQAVGYLSLIGDPFLYGTAPVYRDVSNNLYYLPVQGMTPKGSPPHVWPIKQYWHDEAVELFRKPDGSLPRAGLHLMAPHFSPGFGSHFVDDFGVSHHYAQNFRHKSAYWRTGVESLYDAWLDTDGEPH